ncbi:phage portal protein [Deinococcus cellulosilyticus]|uniref:Portal protein n=1 Tax=Deinococcus cellulosilyticus (strain DSM 18568 / NBRC 106333 / KACC 11606 / 5516J-15) TaxID=1223518 RepID=A0A511N2Y0_DEIC1|nr:phage portal protein [Deinococcus cellulosilyticus]GEM47202.1 hypothetical protein DC3_28370 [Deinococcus cellulosilyticus NBRC 106333 = KACC 11606]
MRRIAGEAVAAAVGSRELEFRVEGMTISPETEQSRAASTANYTLIPWPLDPEKLIDYWYGNPWLAAVGNLIADALAGASIELSARESSTDGTPLSEPSQDEYRRGIQWLTRSNFAMDGVSPLDVHGFIRSVFTALDQTGNAFVETLRNMAANEFHGLSVLLPQFVRYEVTKAGQQTTINLYQMDPYLGEFRYVQFGRRDKGNAETREFLHVRHTNTVSSFYGLPAWLPARDSVAVDNSHRTYLKGFFTNHAAPRWMITITEEIPEGGSSSATEDDLEKIYQLVKNYLGANKGDMAGRNLVLQYPGGIKVEATPLDIKIEDPTFKETSRNARDEILAVRHVSLIDLGLPEGGYRATAETQSGNFRQQVLEPSLAPILRLLNEVLHAPAPYGLGITQWDVTAKFERVEDLLKKFEALFKATGVPFLKPNEARQIIGYEAVDGGDDVYIPSSSTPMSVNIPESPIDGN